MAAPVIPMVVRAGRYLAPHIAKLLKMKGGKRAARKMADKITKYPAKAEMFGRKYGPATVGGLGALGTGLFAVDMANSFLGGAEEGLGANTPQPMTDDDAMAMLDQQLMQGRQNVFEEDILGPISKGIERTASEFGRVPSNLTSTLDDLATSNFVGQRANRLAQLSQPMGDSPSLIEIAHRLGLPIE